MIPIAITASSTITLVMITIVFLLIGLGNVPVVEGVGNGSTVVGPVARLIPASVFCGNMPVCTSLVLTEPSCAVPASLPIDDESITSVAPSTRQNFSASSV